MPTILVVDDNKNVRRYCETELEDEGYRVILARDGSEALRSIGRQPPDLVILDVCMPGLNGMETAERIHAERPDVPIVFFTSFDDVCQWDLRSRFATACVSKHEDFSELKGVVAGVLASRRHNRPYRRGLPPAIDCGPPAAAASQVAESI